MASNPSLPCPHGNPTQVCYCGSMNSILDLLPTLPALSPADESLFAAVEARDPTQVQQALAQGANPNAIAPYHVDNGDVSGGLTPLQQAMSVFPGRRVCADTTRALLDGGADPTTPGISGQTPLEILCQRLPANADSIVNMLTQAGARVDLAAIDAVLAARKLWHDHVRVPGTPEIPMLDCLWSHMDQDQRQAMGTEWIMKCAGNTSEPLDYTSIKLVQWLSNHCNAAAPALDNGADAPFAQRLQQRRQPDEEAAATTRLRRDLN